MNRNILLRALKVTLFFFAFTSLFAYAIEGKLNWLGRAVGAVFFFIGMAGIYFYQEKQKAKADS